MSKPQDKRQQQQKLARLEIVATLYKRGYSLRQIAKEVCGRLGLDTYGVATVHNDVKTLLKEWRESRIENMDEALQLELERIDETVRELWEQWEKSKQDYTKTTRKQKGAPEHGEETIRTFQTEREETDIVRLGDVSYISEIRQQLMERRKLLGLYAPEKKDIQGSFASFLIESGMIDEAEKQAGLL